jgi:23S rRNA (adenine1618-N6)-methyltransferase
LKHTRNLHIDSYPLAQLVQSYPALQAYILTKPNGEQTIDFSNPQAVKTLNGALLAHYYQVEVWDIPAGYLCPPVPGRADYVHYIADLLTKDNRGLVPTGNIIKGLDIGAGANLIYPIIATRSYGWQMVGTDIDPVAVKSANTIIGSNPVLTGNINVRLQDNHKNIFNGVLEAGEHFAFCMCNPPFHQSAEQAKASSERKVKNLSNNKSKRGSHLNLPKHSAALNFAGQSNELWCEGGELQFIQRMIVQSRDYANQIEWFSSLVSKKEHLAHIYKRLREVGVADVKTIEMALGQKVSRFVAWRF